ncbi:MAG: hypothetical protein ACRERZ_04325 [Gammaproteobacteria bacterium]
MRSSTLWILGLATIMFCANALAGPPKTKPVDIRDLMTVTEFDQAGLNKLSPDELKAFNAWLNRYLSSRTKAAPSTAVEHAATTSVAVPAAVASPAVANFGADTMAPKESSQTPTRIETRIAGSFTGWSGDTVFKLENGQVWQQAATGFFTDVKLDHPQVVIKKLAFGYLLTLPGHGETVFVRRIK